MSTDMNMAVKKILHAQIDRLTLKSRKDGAGCCGTRYGRDGCETTDFYEAINLEHQIDAYRRSLHYYLSRLQMLKNKPWPGSSFRQIVRTEYACEYLCEKLAEIQVQFNHAPDWEDEYERAEKSAVHFNRKGISDEPSWLTK